jgi:hypothetical protein
MSAFPLAAAGIGGLTGIAGSVIGGQSAGREARRARGFSREQRDLALAYLRAAQFGNTPYGDFDSGDPYAGYPPALAAQFREIDEQLNNPRLTYKESKRLTKARKKLERRASELPPPAIGEKGLRDIYEEDAPDRFAEFDRLAEIQKSESDSARQSLMAELAKLEPQYNDLVGQADVYGSEARTAAQKGYEQAVREGSADVTRSAAARGVANSSIPENARIGVYARTGAQLAGTLADIEARRHSMIDAAKRNRIAGLQSAASALSGFDTNEAARRQSALSNRFGLFSGIADRPIQSYERTNALTASAFSPNALYPQYTPSQGSVGQNIGNALGGLGGTIAGFGLRSFFEPSQQRQQGGNPFASAAPFGRGFQQNMYDWGGF